MTRPPQMSFTAEVVAELAPHVPLLPCCRASLVEGMRLAGGAPDGEAATTLLVTGRPATARLALAALHADGIAARLQRRRTARHVTYALVGDAPFPPRPAGERPCCDRARLRGAFLEAGAVSRPDAAPQAELAAASPEAAVSIGATLARLGIEARPVVRRGRPLLALRSIDGIAALLSVIGAQGGRLRFEEGRVVREVRGGVNRRLNSETANLRRTVDAAVRQARAATRLQADAELWRRTPAAVRDAAVLRRRHPDDSLSRLASRAGTSRSAMAGRLRRLVEMAEGRTARRAAGGFDADGGPRRLEHGARLSRAPMGMPGEDRAGDPPRQSSPLPGHRRHGGEVAAAEEASTVR